MNILRKYIYSNSLKAFKKTFAKFDVVTNWHVKYKI